MVAIPYWDGSMKSTVGGGDGDVFGVSRWEISNFGLFRSVIRGHMTGERGGVLARRFAFGNSEALHQD
jgi:hypothetical protein